MAIGTLIKIIQDIMRKDVGVDGDAQRISQMVWLLFLKIFDDKEKEWKVTIEGYKSPLQSRFQWSNWAADPEGMTGDELIDFVNNDLFPALKKLATSAGVTAHGKVVGGVFEDAYNYMKSGTLLRQVINTIQSDVDFNVQSDRHLFNDIYEKVLADLQSAGNAGEYYTPRAMTQFMVDMIDPKLGESILDPACGTGGFLTCAIEHLRKQEKTADDRLTIQNCIHGVEKKPLPHMLAVTNMMLHGIDLPTNILHDNTLSRPLKDYGPKDRVDIVITNPPFGGMEEDGIENNFPKKYKTRSTADLFLALIMHLLQHDTGRAAIILPDGFLFGEGVSTNIKKELLTEFNLHTIIRMPKGVFSPYTSINTNILFFNKGEKTKQVWFFEHPYPEGYKSYSRMNPLTIQEFDLEKSWWNNRKENQYAWKVSYKDIEAINFNLDVKNPHVEETIIADPEQVFLEHSNTLFEADAMRNKLKSALSKVSYTGDRGAMNLLLQHFDALVTSQDSIPVIKKAILSLAMQGKLVSQSNDSMPAKDIIKGIDKHAHLSIKSPRSMSSTDRFVKGNHSILYNVPSGWVWTTIGDIAQHNSGKTLDKARNSGDMREYITTSNLYWGRFELNTLRQMPIKDKELDRCSAHKGDLLVCEGGEAGRAAVWSYDYDICFQNHIHRVRLYGNINPYYVYYYFRKLAYTGEIDKYRKGVGISNMSSKSLASIPIPLPPLEEQQRIVNTIEYLMRICDGLDEKIRETDQKRLLLLDLIIHQVTE